jgi:hypothetical protein
LRTQPFEEDVVPEAPAPVHADGEPMSARDIGEVIPRDRAITLIGIEELRPTLAQGVVQGLTT